MTAATTSSSGYPNFDYENAGAKPPAPPPSPPPGADYVKPSAVPASLESALRAFDFASSSDDEVATIAGRVMDQLKFEAAPFADSPLTKALGERITQQDSLANALATVLAAKIGRSDQKNPAGASEEAAALSQTMAEVYASPAVLRAVTSDLIKCFLVDPAADGLLQPLMFFKGFHALQVYRVAHVLWERGGAADRGAALLLQCRVSEAFSVDIHPAATIGNGVMLDHATGIVIGATAVLGDDIYMLHQVTLGATGKPTFGAKRHPTGAPPRHSTRPPRHSTRPPRTGSPALCSLPLSLLSPSHALLLRLRQWGAGACSALARRCSATSRSATARPWARPRS